MKVILKKEYLHPDWDAMELQPLTCERPYVQYYAPNNSGGVTLKETGPFDGVSEADEWICLIKSFGAIGTHTLKSDTLKQFD